MTTAKPRSKKKVVNHPVGIETLAHLLREAGLVNPPEEAFHIRMGQAPWRHQSDLLNRLMIYDRYGVYDEPGCVDAETEFLSPTGWKRIDQWNGEQVMQFWPETGLGEFVTPQEYIKRPASKMLKFKTARNIDQVLSPEHRVLMYSTTNLRRDGKVGAPVETTAQNVFEAQNKNTGKAIRTAFELAPREPEPISDAELRLIVAVAADGHFPCQTQRAVLRLKKQRKIDRLRLLLTEANVPFREAPCLPEGFLRFSFLAPRRDKELGEFYWGLNREQLAVVVDEAQHWDGSIDARGTGSYRFNTNSKASADFLQYAAVATGRTASLSFRVREREGRKTATEYLVHVQPGTLYATGGKDWVTEIDNPEGFKYCFSVPSTYLVLRRGGKVFTTGNTGKTLPVLAGAIYNCLIGNKLLVVMPPALLYQLQKTIGKVFIGSEKYVRVMLYNHGPKERDELVRQWQADPAAAPELLLMSYQIFIKESHLLTMYSGIVADEAQALKNPTTQTYRCTQKFLGPVGSRLFWPMTGTPIPNEMIDAYGLISLVTPDAYASYDQFDRLHCKYKLVTMGKGQNAKRFKARVGYEWTERIQQALFKQARRVLRCHVLDIDEPQFVPMPVELTAKHRKLYRHILRHRHVEVDGKLIVAENQQRLRQMMLQVVSNPHMFTENPFPNAMEEWLDQLMDTINVKKNKLVIVIHFQATADRLYEKLTRDKLKPCIVYGGKYKHHSESSKASAIAMDMFDNDDECRVAILHPKSGGAGLDMQKASHFMAFYEPPTSGGDLDQTIARICRGGQEEPVSIYYPEVVGTVMAGRLESCLKKKQLSDEVTFTDSEFLKEMFGGLEPDVTPEELGWIFNIG